MLLFCILGIKCILLKLSLFFFSKYRRKSMCCWLMDITYNGVCHWKRLFQQQSVLQTKSLVLISLLLFCSLWFLYSWRTLQRIMCRSHLFLYQWAFPKIIFLIVFSKSAWVVLCSNDNAFIYTCAHIKFFLFVDAKLRKKKKGKLYSHLLSALGKYTIFCRRENEHWLRKYTGKFVAEGLCIASVGGTAES